MFTLRIRARPKLCSLANYNQRTCAGRLGNQQSSVQFAPLVQAMSTATAAASLGGFWAQIRKYGNTEETSKPANAIEASRATCWNCQKRTALNYQMLCTECGYLQDIDAEINYFDLLNFPRKFQLESQALTQRFRQLQAIVHPDKYSNKSEREQINSAEWSSIINKAYKTLAAPIERGEYLLQQNGLSLPEDNSALDKEFLMEMMERNEEVEDATNADDLNELTERINIDLKAAAEQLNAAFDGCDLKAATAILIKMKYLLSVQQSIKTKLQSSMGIGH